MDKDEKTKDGSVDVAYQNKDISSKYFVEEFKDTFFKVFGLDLPDIVREEPTELLAIEVNDRAMDKLYYLDDGSYAIIDFESVYSEENKVKYLGYTFYNHKGIRFRVHSKSVEKMKNKLRELTDRNNAWSNEYRIQKLQQFIRGWVNYFKLANCRKGT